MQAFQSLQAAYRVSRKLGWATASIERSEMARVIRHWQVEG